LKEFLLGLFVLLSLVSFLVLVAAAYRTYRKSLEYAKMTDIACTLATQFCFGRTPAVLTLENQPLEGVYSFGRENFHFQAKITMFDGTEIGPGIMHKGVEVEVPALVEEVPAKLKVVVWKED
jgi:hypothetical protein